MHKNNPAAKVSSCSDYLVYCTFVISLLVFGFFYLIKHKTLCFVYTVKHLSLLITKGTQTWYYIYLTGVGFQPSQQIFPSVKIITENKIIPLSALRSLKNSQRPGAD